MFLFCFLLFVCYGRKFEKEGRLRKRGLEESFERKADGECFEGECWRRTYLLFFSFLKVFQRKFAVYAGEPGVG